MTKKTTQPNLTSLAINKKPVDFAKALEAKLMANAHRAIDAIRPAIAKTMFGKPPTK